MTMGVLRSHILQVVHTNLPLHMGLSSALSSMNSECATSGLMDEEQKGDHAMTGTTQYFHVGFILISLANLVVIALLVVVFILAVVLRRPERSHLSTLAAPAKTSEVTDGKIVQTEERP